MANLFRVVAQITEQILKTKRRELFAPDTIVDRQPNGLYLLQSGRTAEPVGDQWFLTNDPVYVSRTTDGRTLINTSRAP